MFSFMVKIPLGALTSIASPVFILSFIWLETKPPFTFLMVMAKSLSCGAVNKE